jgi:deoxyribonuclease-4
MLFGAHVSIAGGVENAPQNGHDLGCDAIQLFSKNQQQWKSKPITEASAKLFRARVEEFGLGPSLIHASYLLNLASPDPELWKKSVAGLREEVERAEALGVPWVVVHPGASKEMGPSWGVKRVAEAVREVLESTGGSSGVLLETNAGAGSTIGSSFEELGDILSGVGPSKRVGVCLDTCHVFVAGYAIHTAKGYEETWRAFDRLVGIDRLRAFHLNDAQFPFGSNRDRHEHIGKGLIGEAGWKRLLRDERFRNHPGYLETEPDGVPKDLDALRSLAGVHASKASKRPGARGAKGS